ncbi:hypothetical protein FC96_GL000469 [Secundilactobacillus kimchicus JCM 15530]|uniref:CSD domain-containing protein n=1 Tax=Secundilactobacillus kimchicus JCM 15530 TaxID=1302272 RepID=A0A0R1I0P8_9LACO|nr:hypothetical protein FC96_GL000469 [Secundilactobacillus kimchicus JCM 15530]
MEGSGMLTGVVKSYNEKNGYGFITSDDGENLFVHYTGIEGAGFKTLTAGQKVRFVVVEGAKGPQAVKVALVDDQKDSAKD